MNKLLTRRSFIASAFITTAASLSLLTGCSTKSSNTAKVSSASPISSKAYADELTCSLAACTTYLNPTISSSPITVSASRHVFEGLYEIDMHDYSTYCGLASAPPVKIDELKYEVTIRPEAAFSNGASVSATDVVNAFEAYLANEFFAKLLPFLTPGSVTVQDDNVVAFELSFPVDTILESRLSLVRIYPTDLDSDDLGTLPVGSGPWAFENADLHNGGFISFIPNEHYNGSFPATCEKMTWYISEDAEKRVSEITDGTSLVIEDAPYKSSQKLISCGATVEDLPSLLAAYLVFNCETTPLNNPMVRQALFYAIDIDRLIANTLDEHAKAATSFLPQTHDDYQRAETSFSYDPDKAKELLQKAGQDGMSLRLLVQNNWTQNLVDALISDWKAIGISIESIETCEANTLDNLGEDTPLDFDIALFACDPSIYGNDSDLILSYFFDASKWMSSITRFSNDAACEKIRLMLAEAREEDDEKKRREIQKNTFDVISEQVPLYPLLHREVSCAYIKEALDGFSPISSRGISLIGTTPIQQ